jgi:hypothetical protein
MPPQYDDPDVFAIQALVKGEADADQQKRALNWIINECCKTYDMSYRPDNQTDTVFAEGKRYVGNEIIRMTKMKVGTLKKAS